MDIIENQIDEWSYMKKQMRANKIKTHHVKLLNALFYLSVHDK